VLFRSSQGGQVISLKNEVDFLGTIPSTAEHTWALLLALLRKIPVAFDHVKQGEWNRNGFKGNNLRGKKIGILGLGRVGKQVAHFAEAFGMEVGFFDTVSIVSNYKQHATAADLFQWSDIISIHIPLTPENVGFVNKTLFKNSNPMFIINTSRGAIWNENDMAALLKEGKLVGLATDVITDELVSANWTDNPLIALANQQYNVIVTPHIAGATFESMAMTEAFITQKFLQQHKNKI
jgi:D-3-phosphoglycerate dehydrogenase